jgi:[ribosomal protein S5]-alanine N-acetyltransferase
MPKLDSERLLLRRICRDDLTDISEWESGGDSEREAQRFLDFCFQQYESRGDGPWGILLKETGKLIGNCGYIGIRHFCGEVNYYVAPKYRGQGIATEALKILLNLGFTELGLLRIQARCDPENLSSERVMQKIGMKLNDTEKHAPAGDKSCEQKMYAILRENFDLASTRQHRQTF